jgi:hypothetical protein
MSDDIRNDEALLGAGLPQAVKACMEQLGRDVALLKRLARPSTGEDDAPGDAAALPSRLALLAHALEKLLSEASRPACGTDAADADESTQDASASTPYALDPDAAAYGLGDARLVFGVTMDQWDALDRLMQTLQAHGDVVSASNMADFAQGTLPMVGHAIFDGAMAVREILDQVEVQTLPRAAPQRFGVGEPRAIYAVRTMPAAVDAPCAPAGLPRGPQAHLVPPGRMALH